MVTHYFDLDNLISEYKYLHNQYGTFINLTLKNSNYKRELYNYIKTANYTITLINDKLMMFNVPKRTKRGLINGLGSIIKQITGNLDYDDEIYFDSILNQLKQSQNQISTQLNKQYSINNEIIQKFNETVKIIEHNEFEVSNKIKTLEQLINSSKRYEDLMYAKDLVNQMINLFQVILQILQDIENSITFCSLHTMHPSIITGTELLKELNKISEFYKNQLPFPINSKNIINYENLIKPNCIIKESKIIYFLPIPLIEKKQYNLYYFLSIPNKNSNIILPSTKFAIRHESEVLPLSDICVLISNSYHCSSNQVIIKNNTCERNLLIENSINGCLVSRLNIHENFVEYIPELNQYIGVFVTEETVKEECDTNWSTFKKQGIYLFENSHCTVFIKERPLIFGDVTKSQPIHLEHFVIQPADFQSKERKLPELNIQHIQLSKLDNIQPISPIVKNQTLVHAHRWSTLILYLIIIVTGCFILLKILKRKPLQPIMVPVLISEPVHF